LLMNLKKNALKINLKDKWDIFWWNNYRLEKKLYF
jgi:hypothetical protein